MVSYSYEFLRSILHEFTILECFHCHLEHLRLTQWLIVAIYSLMGDIIDDFHPVNHLPKDGVCSVKPRSGWCMDDEKLASVTIWSSIGHGERSGDVMKLRVEFVLEFHAIDTLPSHASPGRIASLDHETLDDAVEYNPVVVPFLCESDEVRASFWSFLWEEFDSNKTMRRLHKDDGIAVLEWFGLVRHNKI